MEQKSNMNGGGMIPGFDHPSDHYLGIKERFDQYAWSMILQDADFNPLGNEARQDGQAVAMVWREEEKVLRQRYLNRQKLLCWD